MEITKGKIQKAKKVVIYGPEGIGKSTFAARFPGAVFIDTEGSTNDMDVASMGVMSLVEYRMKWYNEDEETAKSKIPEQNQVME